MRMSLLKVALLRLVSSRAALSKPLCLSRSIFVSFFSIKIDKNEQMNISSFKLSGLMSLSGACCAQAPVLEQVVFYAFLSIKLDKN